MDGSPHQETLGDNMDNMEIYRNGLVHQQSNTPLHKLTALLNSETLKELQFGLSGLPDNYAYLFKQKII